MLTENHLKDVITQMATSWMNDYKFSNLPHSFLGTKPEDQSIFHPIVDQMILTPAGELSPAKVGGISSFFILLIGICCTLCIWKFPAYRNLLVEGVNTIWTGCYHCVTSNTYREKKENIKLKQNVQDKKQELLKNINDFNIIKGFESSLNQEQDQPVLVEQAEVHGVPRQHQAELHEVVVAQHQGPRHHRAEVYEAASNEERGRRQHQVETRVEPEVVVHGHPCGSSSHSGEGRPAHRHNHHRRGGDMSE